MDQEKPGSPITQSDALRPRDGFPLIGLAGRENHFVPGLAEAIN